jgi:hypothetical protein
VPDTTTDRPALAYRRTMDALLNTLTERELALVRETERDHLATLDEDALAELHVRIRRARDRFVKLYRRQASARVPEFAGRGTARPKNQRSAGKAEIFEERLAAVSRQLAVAARHSAAELRAERLAAARRPANPAAIRTNQASGTGGTGSRAQTNPRTSQRTPTRSSTTTPAVRRRQASTLATNARRQARRDDR